MSTDEDADTKNARGLHLIETGEYEQACVAFTEAITLRPDFAVAYRNRAQAHRALGRNASSLLDQRRAQLIEETRSPGVRGATQSSPAAPEEDAALEAALQRGERAEARGDLIGGFVALAAGCAIVAFVWAAMVSGSTVRIWLLLLGPGLILYGAFSLAQGVRPFLRLAGRPRRKGRDDTH